MCGRRSSRLPQAEQPTGLRGDLDPDARRRRAAAPGCRCATDAAPTPFRRFSSAKSTNRCINVPKHHTCRQCLPNRPQTPRSTMAPISRGGRPTLDDAPKKIAICRTASQSYGDAAIVSCRSRTPPTGGEAGLLISVDRPRCSRAREFASSSIDLVQYLYTVNMPRGEPYIAKRDKSGRSSA